MRVVILSGLAVMLAGCGEASCVSAEQAREWTDTARQAEASGRIYDAWRAYKSIGVAPACDGSDQRKIANEHRGRLAEEINLAHAAIEKAIRAFRAANGRLPASLDEVMSDIPDSALRAVMGFGYKVEPDGESFYLSGYAS